MQVVEQTVVVVVVGRGGEGGGGRSGWQFNGTWNVGSGHFIYTSMGTFLGHHVSGRAETMNRRESVMI